MFKVVLIIFVILLMPLGLFAHDEGLPHQHRPGEELELLKRVYIFAEIVGGVVLLSGLWVMNDARSRRMGRNRINGIKGLSPAGWLIVTIALWPLAFPLYLWTRFKAAKSR